MLGQDVRLGLTATEMPSLSRELVFRKLSQLLVMQAGLHDAVLPSHSQYLSSDLLWLTIL